MEVDAFRPARPGPAGLFVDTTALFSLFYGGANRHDAAKSFFDAQRTERLPYQLLLTNRYVLDELATLLQSRASHRTAATALDRVGSSGLISVLSVDDTAFQRTVERFRRYDDHAISFTDHTIGVQADRRDVDHVLAFDGDFEALGLTTIPHWSS